jgi:hypothetical protein
MHRRHSLARSLRFVTGLTGVSLSCVLLTDARADWPAAGQPLTITSTGPSPGADLTNPANWPNDPDYSGYWNFWSFLPMQGPGAPPYLSADVALNASGMSIDKAWESTIGLPDVKIAIIDSGIEWEQPDLINKVWLNAGELTGTAQPRTSGGAACGGTGALAGYDCDGDGIFTMRDYAEDPRMTPIVPGDMCLNPDTGMPVSDRMMGDVNHNCILDPGDLIELYSNGVDEDANGYTDDIAGWDFYKDDNNPYDDVRYGHGTGEAKDSSAEGNNSISGIGVCPMCRFMMLRAGNSFIANSSNFAKAAIYATDNGVSVIQEALGAVNLTGFARAAIDYAYSKNVIVVASMADENSRHHNLPGTYNHTLPVHAIGYTTSGYSTTDTFLNFINCTNYGGQLMLSASGTACSSEATGKTAGVSGLIYSYGLQQATPLAFTAEEVMQLQKMTADVVNVPESRAPATASEYYESLPGFSQRFGYGRINVASAMAKIKAGLIPPEVEILSPAWFQTLYSDRVTGPVPVIGRVVAARATSYDFTVQWAPGVEPADSDFKTLAATVSNVPGKTVTGGASTPLAMLDPSAINTAHTADPDSPMHENDRTITIRVQATAHYPGGTVNGEARRSIAIVNQLNGLDTDLLPGFPLAIGGSAESGAKLADINGDGVRDIVLTTNDGSVHVFSVKGGPPTEVAGFPYRLRPLDGLDPSSPVPSLPSYLTAPAYLAGSSGGIDPKVTREAVDGAAAVGDVNGDGKPDIVFASWEGTLYVVNAAGQDVTGWPQRLPLVPSCPEDPNLPKPPGACMDVLHDITRGSFASPVLVDFNGDGKLEIVLAAFDGNVYVYNGDGTQMSGFPVSIHSTDAYKYDHIITTPAVADYNKDGIPDIAVGSNETIGNQGNIGFFYIVDGRGTNAPGGPYLPGWPILISSLYSLPIVGQGTNASPVAVDLNGDGTSDVLLQGNAQPPLVLPGSPGPQTGSNPPPTLLPALSGGPSGFVNGADYGALSNALSDTMLPLFSHPSVGDLDQDGTPDVVMSGGSVSLALNIAANNTKPFQQMGAMWNGKTGQMMPGSPFLLEDFSFLSNQAIADITGDNYPEVILGTGGYFLHAVDACGTEAPNWPKFTGGWMTASPAVGDINGNGTLAVVESTRDGYLYAWGTKGSSSGVIQWESFHHDNANTGNYATKLDQGSLELAAKPIDCNALPKRDAGGGGTDGGTKPKPDAGSTGGDGGSMTPVPGGGGCGCTLGVGAARTGSVWLGLGGLVLASVRRRRTSRARGRR